ncbi:MAG: helix-turn-helix transcriptional regulator [Aeromonas veronii]
MDTLPESGYMRPAQVVRHFQISESTLWNWVKSGKFCQPLRLSDGVTRFDVADIRAWLAKRREA